MLVAVRGKGVTRLDVRRTSAGTMALSSGTNGEWFFDKAESPWGGYQISVNTTDPDTKPELMIKFNVP
jgi:hypothetical protein